jgi:hypothetical protein
MIARCSLFETEAFEFRIPQYRGRWRRPRQFDEVHILPGGFKCRACECYDKCLPCRCPGAPASSSDQWLFHITKKDLYAMEIIPDKKIKDEYRDLRMMQDRIDGQLIETISAAWGCTVRTARSHIKATASECMRQAMEQTQGDPDHPSSPRFTIEEFTKDPRAAMVAIMRSHIAAIEEKYTALQ